MRILLILPHYLDTHSKRFLNLLLAAGQEVVSVGKQNPLPEPHSRYTFIRYPEIVIPSHWRGERIWRLIRDYGTAFNLGRIWKTTMPDVAHTINIDTKAYHCALAKIHPSVLTALGSDINNVFEAANKDSRHWNNISISLRAADYVTADTAEVLARCEIISGKNLKSELFYFGIDTDLFQPRSEQEKSRLRQELDIPDQAKVILSTRRLHPKMNHELVLKAFAKLIFEDSLNAFLILRRFSIDSERYLFDLTNLIESLGIGGRVKWVGETNYENLPLLYSFSDVAVNVPIQDGLPVTIFEASACQTPVITSDLPAYQEFISKGYYKRIPSNDLSSIVIALREVLYRKNSNGSKYLEHNRQLVKDKASQEIAIRQALRIYSELTNGIVNNNVI